MENIKIGVLNKMAKHLAMSALIAYAVICITTRVSMLKSLAGFQPNS